MINNNRIVPVERIDLLSLYATMLKMAGQDFDVLEAATADGQFAITEAPEKALFANQPVKSLEVDASVASSGLALYFVADYDYSGFIVKARGSVIPVETTGDAVVADGCTLYCASASGGTVTITNIMTGDPLSGGGINPISGGGGSNTPMS